MRYRSPFHSAIGLRTLGSYIKRRKVVAQDRAGTKKLLDIVQTD